MSIRAAIQGLGDRLDALAQRVEQVIERPTVAISATERLSAIEHKMSAIEAALAALPGTGRRDDAVSDQVPVGLAGVLTEIVRAEVSALVDDLQEPLAEIERLHRRELAAVEEERQAMIKAVVTAIEELLA